MKESLQHSLNNVISLAAFAVVIGAMLFVWQLLSAMPYSNLTAKYAPVDKELTHDDIIRFHAGDHDWQPYATPLPPIAEGAEAVYISWEVPPDTP
ncbi:MAG: GGDEF domain-containing protein, partial [Selenomonas sp.]|nr:GGDEF domain-containing protein [Selenomonas sp.]